MSVDGTYSSKPDVAIVVFGEEPYAEGQGDTESIDYQHGNKTDLILLKSLKDAGIPTISLFISGRPLWVNPELNASDAFVAAWLPGSEGIAVSDLLFKNIDGSLNTDFTGKLSFSWPKRPDQYLLNKGDVDYDPLFAYGYGLNASEKSSVGDNLPTDFDDLVAPVRSQIEILSRKPNANLNEFISDADGQSLISANSSKNVAVAYRTVDKDVQEDARRLEFSALGSYGFIAKAPLDITGMTEQGSIVIDVNLLKRPSSPVTVRVDCGESCSKEVDITAQMAAISLDDQWQRIDIPLTCFHLSTEQAQSIVKPFELRASDLSLELSGITLKSTSLSMTCD